MPILDRDGDVFVLYLGDDKESDSENRFHPDYVDAIHAKLDEVEAHQGPKALVTTSAGKFYSNGLDTDWLFGNFDQIHSYLDKVHTIFTRLLTFPTATVAAVNGHAFGAGAMMATSHDFRVMRADRGFYCLPEINLNMPFTVGMSALITNRLGNQNAVATMTTGRRFGAQEALAAGIVDATADADAVLSTAVARAAELVGTQGQNLAGIKRAIHADALAGLAVKTDESNLAFNQG